MPSQVQSAGIGIALLVRLVIAVGLAIVGAASVGVWLEPLSFDLALRFAYNLTDEAGSVHWLALLPGAVNIGQLYPAA
jgi:hypothetical protein